MLDISTKNKKGSQEDYSYGEVKSREGVYRVGFDKNNIFISNGNGLVLLVTGGRIMQALDQLWESKYFRETNDEVIFKNIKD